MSDFVTQVMPVVEKFAQMRFWRDEAQVTRVISLAWYIWRERRVDCPPSVYAHLAARKVAQGYDLPGCGTSAADALRHATSGSGMDEVADRSPGPDHAAAQREQYARVTGGLDRRRRRLVSMFEAGKSNKAVAATLRISPSRATQLRQELMARLDN